MLRCVRLIEGRHHVSLFGFVCVILLDSILFVYLTCGKVFTHIQTTDDGVSDFKVWKHFQFRNLVRKLQKCFWVHDVRSVITSRHTKTMNKMMILVLKIHVESKRTEWGNEGCLEMNEHQRGRVSTANCCV